MLVSSSVDNPYDKGGLQDRNQLPSRVPLQTAEDYAQNEDLPPHRREGAGACR